MKILVCLSTFNRPVITDICLRNLTSIRDDRTGIVIYDDASTAYDASYLARYADDVVRFASNGGITRSRAKAVRDFVYRYTDFDLLYLTDNDTIHDPAFSDVLRDAFSRQQDAELSLPVCLYNTTHHHRSDNILGEYGGFYCTKGIPGVSHCYNREIAAELVGALNASPDLEFSYGWDFNFIEALKRPCLMSQISYLEHFARDRNEGGMHNQCSGAGEAGRQDFERDRALNPTPFLVERRDGIIDALLS